MGTIKTEYKDFVFILSSLVVIFYFLADSQNGGRKESPKNITQHRELPEIDDNNKNYQVFKQAMIDSISESNLSMSEYLGSENHDLVLKRLYSSISVELNLADKISPTCKNTEKA